MDAKKHEKIVFGFAQKTYNLQNKNAEFVQNAEKWLYFNGPN